MKTLKNHSSNSTPVGSVARSRRHGAGSLLRSCLTTCLTTFIGAATLFGGSAALFGGSALAQTVPTSAPVGSDAGVSQVGEIYVLKEGETLRDVALRFLKTEEGVHELLALNGGDSFKTAAAIPVGYPLVIPGKIRVVAYSQLNNAKSQLEIADDGYAAEFAADNYKKARNALTLSQANFKKARYYKSINLSKDVIKHCVNALDQVENVVKVKADAFVSAANGLVEISKDGKEWASIRKGAQVPVSWRIRTDATGRCTLVFQDESVFQLKESSMLLVMSHDLDKRMDNKRYTRIKLFYGNTDGNITPKRHPDSVFEVLDANDCNVAIRGTSIRFGTIKDKVTRLSVISGETSLSVRGGDSVDVVKGFGVEAIPGQPLRAPVALIPAPAPKHAPHFVTGKMQPKLSWNAVDAAIAYHVEIAQDDAFNDIVDQSTVPLNEFTPAVLKSGDYFWRVSSLDANGIEGSSTFAYTFEVKKLVDFIVKSSRDIYLHQGKQYVSSDNVFSFISSDADSSIEKWEVAYNGGPFQAAGNQVKLTDAGNVVMKVRGLLADGSSAEVQTLRFNVDTDIPTVKHSMAELEKRRTFRISLEAQDDTGIAKILYSIDGKDYIEYDKPFNITRLVDNSFRYKAIDFAGNESKLIQVPISGAFVSE